MRVFIATSILTDLAKNLKIARLEPQLSTGRKLHGILVMVWCIKTLLPRPGVVLLRVCKNGVLVET